MSGRQVVEPPAIALERLALLEGIERHEGEGELVPCRTGDVYVTAAWTAELVSEQRVAAAACSPCPAKRECRAFGLTWPDLPGVYGGVTQIERRRAANQPSKETA